jgi:hypothetical protein
VGFRLAGWFGGSRWKSGFHFWCGIVMDGGGVEVEGGGYENWQSCFE